MSEQRRKCAVCGLWCELHRHLVRQNDLPLLREKHCAHPDLKAKLKVQDTICCRHFETHSHNAYQRRNTQLKTEFCAPELLSQHETLSVQEVELEKTTKKEGKRRMQVERSKKASSSLIPLSPPVTRSQSASPLYHLLPTSHSTLQQVRDYISLSSPFDHSVCVPIADVKALLLAHLDHAVEVEKLVYHTFKKGFRKDLVFWTGFENIDEFDAAFLHPLLEFYDSFKNHSQLPSSTLLIEDRVLWLTILMWSGMTFRRLFEQLRNTSSYPFDQLRPFISILKKTASDLASALKGKISFTSLSQWILMNTGKGMEKFNHEKKLIFILDGTSLNVFAPSKHAHLQRSFWVSYKKHHAWRYFICTTTSGEIVWISNLYLGCENDGSMYQASGLKDLLENNYPTDNWDGWQLVLGGDKGYVFIIPPDGWELLLTQSAEKEKKGSKQTFLPEEGDPHDKFEYKRVLDTDFAIPRSVVERTICLIKRWRYLSCGLIRVNQGDTFLQDLIHIASSYANQILQLRNEDSFIEDDEE